MAHIFNLDSEYWFSFAIHPICWSGYGNTDTIKGVDSVAFMNEFLKCLHIDKPSEPVRVIIVSPSMSGSYSLPFLMAQPDKFVGYVPVAPVGTEKYKAEQYSKIQVCNIQPWIFPRVQDFLYKSPFASKCSWKKKSSMYCVPTCSFLFTGMWRSPTTKGTKGGPHHKQTWVCHLGWADAYRFSYMCVHYKAVYGMCLEGLRNTLTLTIPDAT